MVRIFDEKRKSRNQKRIKFSQLATCVLLSAATFVGILTWKHSSSSSTDSADDELGSKHIRQIHIRDKAPPIVSRKLPEEKIQQDDTKKTIVKEESVVDDKSAKQEEVVKNVEVPIQEGPIVVADSADVKQKEEIVWPFQQPDEENFYNDESVRIGYLIDDDDKKNPFIWQKYMGDSKGVLFIAHGCGHSMTDWWPPSHICTDCIGLPEEKDIVANALLKNMIVVAMSSINRDTKCWSEQDGPIVAKVLKSFSIVFNNKPIYALGVFSGGQFISTILPKSLNDINVKLSGFISEVYVPSIDNAPINIPSVYITMNRDKQSDEIASQLAKQYAIIGHISVQPLSIHENYFSHRIGDIYNENSKKMVDALRDSGYLDDNNMLKDDPQNTDWRSILQQYAINDNLIQDQSPIDEVIHLAWAMKEVCRDGFVDALNHITNQDIA